MLKWLKDVLKNYLNLERVKMTYKRFTYIPFDGFKDLDKELDAYEVLNLLNELHEENRALRGDNKLGLDIYLEFYQENQKLQRK